jgi:hypothetical protein
MNERKINREQAIQLSASGFWEPMDYRERAMFQFFEDRLCMPFDVFHEAMCKTLGRPVYTHEFASSNREALQAELLGHRDAPTLTEIIEMIPAHKRIILNL